MSVEIHCDVFSPDHLGKLYDDMVEENSSGRKNLAPLFIIISCAS
jgi:hypothetical protein